MTPLLQAFKMLKSDKILLTLAVIPILIGVGIYALIGRWLYSDVYAWGRELITSNIESSWGSLLAYILIIILSILFFFLVNWTFVIVVSLVASPFNDLMSSRVAHKLGVRPPESAQGLKAKVIAILKIFLNEIKKMALILSIGFIGLTISFFLPPLALLISAGLVAISFVDYSWGRDDLSLKACFRDLFSHIVPYGIWGGFFLFLIGIPILNILVIPFAVIIFTILYEQKKTTIAPASHQQVSEELRGGDNEGSAE